MIPHRIIDIQKLAVFLLNTNMYSFWILYYIDDHNVVKKTCGTKRGYRITIICQELFNRLKNIYFIVYICTENIINCN